MHSWRGVLPEGDVDASIVKKDLRVVVPVAVKCLARAGTVVLRCTFLHTRTLPSVHVLGRAMERDEASTDPMLLRLAFAHVLTDVHLEFDVELAAVTHLLLQILAVDDVVDRRSEAGAQKAIAHVLADHDVVAAAFSEEIHARGHLGVAQKRRTRHGVVPVAVESSEGEHRGEGVLVEASETDA